MSSIFTKIMTGKLPCYKIAETKDCFAFLDIHPNTRGHTLCIAKREVDKFFDLTKEEYLNLMQFTHKIAVGIEKVIPCNRVAMAVVGLEIPHAHIHLIPINKMSDMNFAQQVSLNASEFEQTAQGIRSALESTITQ